MYIVALNVSQEKALWGVNLQNNVYTVAEFVWINILISAYMIDNTMISCNFGLDKKIL